MEMDMDMDTLRFPLDDVSFGKGGGDGKGLFMPSLGGLPGAAQGSLCTLTHQESGNPGPVLDIFNFAALPAPRVESNARAAGSAKPQVLYLPPQTDAFPEGDLDFFSMIDASQLLSPMNDVAPSAPPLLTDLDFASLSLPDQMHMQMSAAPVTPATPATPASPAIPSGLLSLPPSEFASSTASTPAPQTAETALTSSPPSSTASPALGTGSATGSHSVPDTLSLESLSSFSQLNFSGKLPDLPKPNAALVLDASAFMVPVDPKATPAAASHLHPPADSAQSSASSSPSPANFMSRMCMTPPPMSSAFPGADLGMGLYDPVAQFHAANMETQFDGSASGGPAFFNSSNAAAMLDASAGRALDPSRSLPPLGTPAGPPTKTFRCPTMGCTKSYKNPNGLKYHREHGICEADAGSMAQLGRPMSRGLSTDAIAELYQNTIMSSRSGSPSLPSTPHEDGSTPPMDFAAFHAMTYSLLAAERTGDESTPLDPSLVITHRPYLCRVPSCFKRYKNLNGLKYHVRVSHAGLDFKSLVKNSRIGSPGLSPHKNLAGLMEPRPRSALQ